MKKFTSFQIRLIIIMSIITIIGVCYLMLNSMSTVNGNININKIVIKDKIYTYDIHSDFYFNVSKYDEKNNKIAQFSQLIPTYASIGYDFSKAIPELIINPYDNLNETTLTNDGNLVSNEIDLIKGFAKKFSRIYATQDIHYIEETAKKVQSILKNMYNLDIELNRHSIYEFYEDAIETPINNLEVRSFKLDDINKNLKSKEICKEQWCGNLIKWKFGESDEITLEYNSYVKNTDLEQHLKNQTKNVTIIKMNKINNNLVSKFFMISPSGENELHSYFMDSNGLVYLLRYKYKNPKSLEKYQDDYIKIAFGINFIDVSNFENRYTDLQNNLNGYKDILKEVNKLDEELTQYNIYEHFNLKANLSAKTIKLENIYAIYINDKDFLQTITQERDDKRLINEAIDKLNIFIPSFMKKTYSSIIDKDYSSNLKGVCKDLECVRKLKENNWKVEEK